jgi:hypothetical protein
MVRVMLTASQIVLSAFMSAAQPAPLPPAPVIPYSDTHAMLAVRSPRPKWSPEDEKTPRQKRRGKGATTFYWHGGAYAL